jgi:hypothetical protein
MSCAVTGMTSGVLSGESWACAWRPASVTGDRHLAGACQLIRAGNDPSHRRLGRSGRTESRLWSSGSPPWPATKGAVSR